jgi:nitrogen regulatory protein PII
MREIKALVRTECLDSVVDALHAIEELPGITISLVRGIGRTHSGDTQTSSFGEVQMAKLEIVIEAALEDRVVDAIVKTAYTGHPGDGKIFVYPVARVVRIRTSEENAPAL